MRKVLEFVLEWSPGLFMLGYGCYTGPHTRAMAFAGAGVGMLFGAGMMLVAIKQTHK